MIDATDDHEEASENYFVSMTDMMVGMLFVFIIMLMVFAVNYRTGDDDSKRIKDCLTRLLVKNAELSADIDAKVKKIQDDVKAGSRRSTWSPTRGDVCSPTSARSSRVKGLPCRSTTATAS